MTFVRFPRPRALHFLALGAFGMFFACGPSVQFIYEGNIRFEHCYRLDLDESIAPPHRRACWVEWLDQFSKGQTRDRLEYAKRRILSLETGDGAALHLQLGDPDAGTPAVAADPAPVPTSPHAPPPARIPAPAPSAAASAPMPETALGIAGAAGAPNAATDTKNSAPKRRRAKKPEP